jgi:hypothetical protein
MKAKQADINKLYELSCGSYSFDRYSNWRACCSFLLRRGLSIEESEVILNSKWTRWAGDASNKRYGKVTYKDLQRFMDRMSIREFSSLDITDAYYTYNGVVNEDTESV